MLKHNSVYARLHMSSYIKQVSIFTMELLHDHSVRINNIIILSTNLTQSEPVDQKNISRKKTIK